jgi:hypothetical protein
MSKSGSIVAGGFWKMGCYLKKIVSIDLGQSA